MRKTLLIILCCHFIFTFGVKAQSLPLEIDADSSDCGTDLENCTLKGNVYIQQGDAKITADKLFSRTESEWELSGNIQIEKTGMTINANQANIKLVKRQLKTFILKGQPVHFKYLVADDNRARGQANNIVFDLTTRVITLDGDAELIGEGNELKGDHIEYDIDAERLKANNQGKGDGRVHLIFEPPATTEQSENQQ